MQSWSLLSENAAIPSLHVPIVINTFCLPVKLSPHCSLLAASQNIATSQPRHGVFACLCMVREEPGGGCNHVEMIGLEAGIVPQKFQAILSTFSPSKSHFSVLFGMFPPPGGLLLSILAPKWAALSLTQCLRVPHQNSTSTCFSTVFQVLSCLTHLLMARTVYVPYNPCEPLRYRKKKTNVPTVNWICTMRNCQGSATTDVDPGPGADVQAGTEHMHVPDPAALDIFHAHDAM